MGSETKVTYVTLSADSPEARQGFAQAIETVKSSLGKNWPLYVGGKKRQPSSTTASTSPIDTRVVVGHAASATTQDVEDAVRAARDAFPAWRRTPWEKRAEILGRVAEGIRRRRYELSVWMIQEMGKNRAEALGEVEETADLIDYYNDRMKEAGGFVRRMGQLSESETNTSVMRPYGVWGVISPWNFPYALLAAPMAAALLTGNTVVGKPSSETPICGALMAEVFLEAGLPDGVLNLVTGSGRVVGDVLTNSPDVAGATFTGSYEVGFQQLYRRFPAVYPRPCIVEMGGKNPALIMDSADLDRAVRGVFRAAFGMNGHKCSACSRVYVHEKVADDFLARLTDAVRKADIGNPLDREVFVGPLATQSSLDDYEKYVAIARKDNALHEGGQRITDGDFAHGHYARPTILKGLPEQHELIKTELFVPILAVKAVRSLDEALALANDTTFGLTAGLFSQDQREIDEFQDRIEAGVIYINRANGATTGAWPGVQPFGGWKGSGSTGKNIGGHYTLGCYLREQSRTIVA